jgi:NAD-dependent DNA ligase
MTKSSPRSHIVELRQEKTFQQSEVQIDGMETEQDEKKETIFTNNMTITFEGKCFQFSGTLEFGKREDAIAVVEKLGGYIPSGNSLTTLVNYLVVGNLKTRALKRNGYGGKINKALSLNRNAHRQIQIILESDFVKAVLKAIHTSELKEMPVIKTKTTYRALANRVSKATRSSSTAVHFT